MSRKDYILIAEQLKRSMEILNNSDNKDIVFPYIRAIVLDLSQALYSDNNNFDEIRFTKACGII